MNPFRIGQSLIVQFGTRQWFVVADLSGERCAMRFPNMTFVRWYSVADLLRWNPECAAPVVPLLPAPRLEVNGYKQHRKVQLRDIQTGDVLLYFGNRPGLWRVCRIGQPYNVKLNLHETEMRRWAQLQNIHTFEIRRECLRWNGGGAETVAGRIAA